jgi:hypothetical protein
MPLRGAHRVAIDAACANFATPTPLDGVVDLLVAKSAVPSEGNWAGFWGNAAVNQKLHDIATSGPAVLTPTSPD